MLRWRCQFDWPALEHQKEQIGYKLIDLGTLGAPNSSVVAAQSAPAYKVLYAFTGGADGGQPMADLIRDKAGNLYGTTEVGGILTAPCAPSGCGVVFKLDPSGKETVLYRFTGGEDGASPEASLARDSAGNFYSSARSGGRSCIWSGNGCGVIFKLDPTAGKETVLYAFTGGADGWSPVGSLLLDEGGTLYGVTSSGGWWRRRVRRHLQTGPRDGRGDRAPHLYRWSGWWTAGCGFAP